MLNRKVFNFPVCRLEILNCFNDMISVISQNFYTKIMLGVNRISWIWVRKNLNAGSIEVFLERILMSSVAQIYSCLTLWWKKKRYTFIVNTYLTFERLGTVSWMVIWSRDEASQQSSLTSIILPKRNYQL